MAASRSRWSAPTTRLTRAGSLATPQHLFSHFDCGASLFGKAAKFRRVVQRAGVKPSQAIAIGDEVRDIEAARAAGIACGAVTWGYAAPEALRALGPDLVFDRMEDVAVLLGNKAAWVTATAVPSLSTSGYNARHGRPPDRPSP